MNRRRLHFYLGADDGVRSLTPRFLAEFWTLAPWKTSTIHDAFASVRKNTAVSSGTEHHHRGQNARSGGAARRCGWKWLADKKQRIPEFCCCRFRSPQEGDAMQAHGAMHTDQKAPLLKPKEAISWPLAHKTASTTALAELAERRQPCSGRHGRLFSCLNPEIVQNERGWGRLETFEGFITFRKDVIKPLVYNKHWFSHAFKMPNAFFMALFYNSHFHLHELITTVKLEGQRGWKSEISSWNWPDTRSTYDAT